MIMNEINKILQTVILEVIKYIQYINLFGLVEVTANTKLFPH